MNLKQKKKYHIGFFLSSSPRGCSGKGKQVGWRPESYQACEHLSIDFDTVRKVEYAMGERLFAVQIVNSTPIYIKEMRKMFDFHSLKVCFGEEFDAGNHRLFTRRFHSLLSAGKKASSQMVKVSGAQSSQIFGKRLGIPSRKYPEPKFFGRLRWFDSNPNPVYREDFVNLVKENDYDFGAVISPDGNRCLIVGKDGFLASPSDTLAVIANLSKCIPFFQDNPIKEVVRSICTSHALDDIRFKSSLKLALNLGVAQGIIYLGWQNILPYYALKFYLNGKKFCTSHGGPSQSSIIFGEECSAIGVSTSRLDFKKLPQASVEAFMTFIRDTYSPPIQENKNWNPWTSSIWILSTWSRTFHTNEVTVGTCAFSAPLE
ncbi:phosphoglucomutase-1 [Caerostris extrusa]|uniref:Phosphoglucomutase-1 n=1 Tax=Caerostris extrusa TaxID=172846 RepID=A0AAV4X2E1_CAEEX|nr:phosphoglucomutase-1 [Caerostris extrusa]